MHAGQATIDMHDTSLPGAQRSVAMRVLNWRHAIRALPLRADSAPQPSPYNPTSTDGRERLFVKCRCASSAGATPLRSLPSHSYLSLDPNHTSDCRWLKCREIVCEAEGIKTFRFSQPEAAGTSEKHSVVYQPGQYATFDFQVNWPAPAPSCAWACRPAPLILCMCMRAATPAPAAMRNCSACRRMPAALQASSTVQDSEDV